jgi:hypothetical protein
MAYLRKENETVEMDYPLNKVWSAIAQTIINLKWSIDSTDESAHSLKAKTKSSFLSYTSNLSIEASSVAENITRVKVSVETPVTTITSVLDFGKTQERIDQFLLGLSKQLSSDKTESEKKLQTN